MRVNCENELCIYNKFSECNRDEIDIDYEGYCQDTCYADEEQEYDEGNIVELNHERLGDI